MFQVTDIFERPATPQKQISCTLFYIIFKNPEMLDVLHVKISLLQVFHFGVLNGVVMNGKKELSDIDKEQIVMVTWIDLNIAESAELVGHRCSMRVII